jgi:hypothetical protein
MGSRRICGEEWISTTTTASGAGRSATSMNRFSVSVSRVTSSMVRPDAAPQMTKAELIKFKQQQQQQQQLTNKDAEDV